MVCNNSGPAACDFNTYSNSSLLFCCLNWDGKQLTIDKEFMQGEKKMLWHGVWSGITSASSMQIGEMGAHVIRCDPIVTTQTSTPVNIRNICSFFELTKARPN